MVFLKQHSELTIITSILSPSTWMFKFQLAIVKLDAGTSSEMKLIHSPPKAFHMAKPYFTREVHFTNPMGINFAEKSACRNKRFFHGRGCRIRLSFRRWRKVRKPPVFELVAATAHRAVASKLVRIPSLPIKKPPIRAVFLLAEDEGFEPPRTESESGVLPLH